MQQRVKRLRLPDPDICLTEVHPALDQYSHCRTANPGQCPFVLPFGRGFFCGHPEREKFLLPLALRRKPAN
jgi:hypothetical protein